MTPDITKWRIPIFWGKSLFAISGVFGVEIFIPGHINFLPSSL